MFESHLAAFIDLKQIIVAPILKRVDLLRINAVALSDGPIDDLSPAVKFLNIKILGPRQ